MIKFIKKLKASEFGMHVREKLYPRFDSNPVISPKKIFAKSIMRYNACESKKSKQQIKQEIAICKNFWKCFPYHYYMYNLYREDIPLTKKELINYIPDFFWYYLYLPHHTSYKLGLLTDNKIITEQFFRSLEILQPDNLCCTLDGRLFSPDMNPITFGQLHREFVEKNCEKIFVKPAESGQGKGIYVFRKSNEMTYIGPENALLNETFLSAIGKDKDYIVQQGIIQRQEISAIYPHSVNTIRVITENTNGNVHVPCAMMRIGRGRHEIDNASAGGIFLKIDINSGKAGDFALSYEGEKFSHHPDTQFYFHNFKIPFWEDILKFARESGGKIPFFTHLAWDIALSEKGPMAIEMNLSPGISGLQISCGGLREAFGIENPDYYWKNPGKRKEQYL